jgi:hypothetical protein
MIEEVIVYIAIISFAFWAGWKMRGIIMLAAMSDNPDKIIKMLEEVKKINKAEVTNGEVKVEVAPEKVNGYWYAYAKETGQFLAQAPTLEEAIKLASIRFPNKTFWCETLASNLTKSIDANKTV